MQLHVSVDRLARFAERQRLGNLHTNRGEARCELINNSDIAILTGYNALMRGLAEYYKLGTLWKREVSRLHHLWWWSLMKTLSRKHKCSVRTMAEKLRNGDCLGLWYEGRHERRFMPMFRLADVSPALMLGHVDRQPLAVMHFAGITPPLRRKTQKHAYGRILCEPAHATSSTTTSIDAITSKGHKSSFFRIQTLIMLIAYSTLYQHSIYMEPLCRSTSIIPRRTPSLADSLT